MEGRKKMEKHLIAQQPAHLISSSKSAQKGLNTLALSSNLLKGNISLFHTEIPSGSLLLSFHLCLSPSLFHKHKNAHSCAHLALSACTALTLCLYLWQQWWELSRDTWLIQPCSLHTPLPPFLFYFTLLHPPTAGQAGGGGSAARAHRPRVRRASTYMHPSPFTSTSYWVIYQPMNTCSAF